ncbi:hypothetical protein SAICODRAFT_70545 [Saitoella complicata NRRL Y-17804]|uniref:uncharacterized protein n=1 Tax=Saitoella complicata (strain BCRC 22490 / CBS 7301 / JCM 7358 / NBRC 10748 / NRRL Y-17804) TaxID=698492 RepID=UPI000867F2AE|nr:uncharacterized protein SAICODRAFT_70545 [Saitoella complicata NRRL Y-17804]ODQ53844.1 hypothetical protein SAICODRAFT_70545 [Saitoella complicata NRRL Y-17804]
MGPLMLPLTSKRPSSSLRQLQVSPGRDRSVAPRSLSQASGVTPSWPPFQLILLITTFMTFAPANSFTLFHDTLHLIYGSRVVVIATTTTSSPCHLVDPEEDLQHRADEAQAEALQPPQREETSPPHPATPVREGIPAASLDIAESIRGRRRSQTRAAQAGEMLAQEHTHEAAETAQPTSPSLPNPPPAAITSRDEEDLALQAGGSVLQAGGSPTNVQSHAHAVQFRMEIASIAREADPSSPLDPPLIVRLRVHDPNSNDILGEQYHPHLLAHVGLYDEHGINILSPPDRYLFRGPNLAASPAIFNEPDLTLEAILGPDHTVYSGSAPSHRSVFFVYPGLHITRPGRYRMRLRLVGIGSDSPGGGVSPAAARLVASINAQIAVALQSSSTSDLSTSNSSGSGSASSENAGSSPVLPYRPPYPAHPPVGTPP